MFLCDDNMFRSGYWALSGKGSTLIYKSNKAALKKLMKVSQKLFPEVHVVKWPNGIIND